MTPPQAAIVRPALVESIALQIETHPLPSALAGDAGIEIAVLPSGVTVVGGAAGLFELGSEGLTAIDDLAVLGAATLEDGTLVLARESGLWIYDGALTRSPLSGEIERDRVHSLATRGGELWIGTDAGLHEYAGGRLLTFTGTRSVTSIVTFTASPRIALETAAGLELLEPDSEGGWRAQSLEDEVDLDGIAVGPGGRTFGLARGALFERVKVEDARVAWRPAALDPGATAPAASAIETWAVDPETGALWIVRDVSLSRLDTFGGHVSQLARPSSWGRILAARVTRDGALWLSDGTTLARIGNAGPPVTFATSVAGFAQENCLRCHAMTATARPVLEDHQNWVDNVDRIIRALEERRMPADGQPLRSGTVELVKRWRDDGLRP